MKRLWFTCILISIITYNKPILLIYTALSCILGALALTIFKKVSMNNKESALSIFMSCIHDVVHLAAKVLLKLNFVSEVEAMRIPNYLTLLLKPHPGVAYEKVQIHDDKINIIIYRPKEIRNNGLIVYSHGGGWVLFTARMFHSAVSWVAHDCQMVTVSVDYKRPPEQPFPRPLLDVYYTVLWAQLNAKTIGIDPSKVVLMGDSCGGNLTAATAALHRDRKNNGTKTAHSFPAIKAQVLIYPVLQAYDCISGSFAGKDMSGLKKYVSYYLAGDLSMEDQSCNPEFYDGYPAYHRTLLADNCDKKTALEVTRELVQHSSKNLQNIYCFPLLDDDPSGLPPTYVMALTRDAIKDDAVLYAKWLKYHGVHADYVEVADADHGCMFLYGTDYLARSCLRDIASWLWKHSE